MTWISASTELPPHNAIVLATYRESGKRVFIIASHLERWKERSNMVDSNDEYLFELDEYFLKQGWYERVSNWGDFESIAVYGEITHWMPLPPAPQQELEELNRNV